MRDVLDRALRKYPRSLGSPRLTGLAARVFGDHLNEFVREYLPLDKRSHHYIHGFDRSLPNVFVLLGIIPNDPRLNDPVRRDLFKMLVEDFLIHALNSLDPNIASFRRHQYHYAGMNLRADVKIPGHNHRGELDGWGRYLDTSSEAQRPRGLVTIKKVREVRRTYDQLHAACGGFTTRFWRAWESYIDNFYTSRPHNHIIAQTRRIGPRPFMKSNTAFMQCDTPEDLEELRVHRPPMSEYTQSILKEGFLVYQSTSNSKDLADLVDARGSRRTFGRHQPPSARGLDPQTAVKIRSLTVVFHSNMFDWFTAFSLDPADFAEPRYDPKSDQNKSDRSMVVRIVRDGSEPALLLRSRGMTRWHRLVEGEIYNSSANLLTEIFRDIRTSDLLDIRTTGGPWNWEEEIDHVPSASRGSYHQYISRSKSNDDDLNATNDDDPNAKTDAWNPVDDPKGKKPDRSRAESSTTSERPAKKLRTADSSMDSSATSSSNSDTSTESPLVLPPPIAPIPAAAPSNPAARPSRKKSCHSLNFDPTKMKYCSSCRTSY